MALGTRMDRYYDIITETQVIARNSRWRRANMHSSISPLVNVHSDSSLLDLATSSLSLYKSQGIDCKPPIVVMNLIVSYKVVRKEDFLS